MVKDLLLKEVRKDSFNSCNHTLLYIFIFKHDLMLTLKPIISFLTKRFIYHLHYFYDSPNINL